MEIKVQIKRLVHLGPR